MCGISGFIAFKNKFVLAKHLEQMTQQIKHRGPDDEGYFAINLKSQEFILSGVDSVKIFDKKFAASYLPQQNVENLAEEQCKLGFGHRRLAILDLSALGHQPLSIDQGNYWICFNGEVFNYLEIKLELELLGYNFISTSDTEVILAAYKEWGEQCLAKFNGMFAFLVYDKLKQQVFIARDRFGIKPLYCYKDSQAIYFASEIKQFSILPSWQAKLNHQMAYDFLVYGLSDHRHETLFQDVFQLRGGEFAIINLANFEALNSNLEMQQILKTKQWYELPQQAYLKGYNDAKNDFRTVFEQAVKLRLRSDVDIGSCLSGGLDSSAIVSVMANELDKQGKISKLKTFSACSEHAQFDEREYIEEVVKQTQAQSFYCYPDLERLLFKMDQITWHQDEPFGSTSIYAQWAVFAEAKQQKVKVLLDGQGADEQLAGYQGLYFQILLNQLLRRGNIVQLIKELKLLKKNHGFDSKKGLLKAIMSLFPDRVKVVVGKILGKQQYALDWLNTEKLKVKQINPFIQTGLAKANIKQTLKSQICYNNLSMLLHWEDRDSMAHSIESRVPFLDFRLVELIFSMPDEFKIYNGVTKRVLRDGLDGVLPNKIKNRMNKLGFATPEEIWLRDNEIIFRQLISEAVTISGGILKLNEV
ncbi:MAG: asparagine synthase (glutamine-hydrolyzing), partial [Burkholderiales bacterium]|nr:asparagine synthase (glutamine-hydrolyzing) [Burkholderiales bacterium]